MADKSSAFTFVPLVDGSRRGYVAKCADIDDGDTLVVAHTAAPLHKNIDNQTDGVVVSATFSAGTYTFAVASAGSNKAITMRVLL